MTTLTKIQIRPNTSVGFYFGMPKEHREALNAKYLGANPTLLEHNISTTADLLTFVQTLIFTTPEACAQYQAEAVVVAVEDARIAHCSANNITSSESVV